MVLSISNMAEALNISFNSLRTSFCFLTPFLKTKKSYVDTALSEEGKNGDSTFLQRITC